MPSQQEHRPRELDDEFPPEGFAKAVAMDPAQAARNERTSRRSHSEPRSDEEEADVQVKSLKVHRELEEHQEESSQHPKQPRKTANNMYAPPLQRGGSKHRKKKKALLAEGSTSDPGAKPARRRNRRAVLVNRQQNSKPMVFGHYSGAEAWHEVLSEYRDGKKRSALYTTVTVLSNATVALALLSMAFVLLEQDLTYQATGRCRFFNTSESPPVTFQNPLPVPTPYGQASIVADVVLQYPLTDTLLGIMWGYYGLSLLLAIANLAFHYFLFELLDRRQIKDRVKTILLAVFETLLCLIVVPPNLAYVSTREYPLDAANVLSSKTTLIFLSNEINSLTYFRIYFVFRILKNGVFMPPRSISYSDIRSLILRIQLMTDQRSKEVTRRYLDFLQAHYSPYSLSYSIRWLMRTKPIAFSVLVILIAYLPLAFFLANLERCDPRSELPNVWVSFYFVMESFATVGFGDVWVFNPYSRVLVVFGCVFLALGIVACISAVLINVVKLTDAQQTVAFHVLVTAWQKEYRYACAVVIQRAFRLYGNTKAPIHRKTVKMHRAFKRPRGSVRAGYFDNIQRVFSKANGDRLKSLQHLRNSFIKRKEILHARPVAMVSTSARQRSELFNFKLIQRQFQRAKKLQSEIEVLGMQVAAATQNMGFYAAQMNDRQQRRQRRSQKQGITDSSKPGERN